MVYAQPPTNNVSGCPQTVDILEYVLFEKALSFVQSNGLTDLRVELLTVVHKVNLFHCHTSQLHSHPIIHPRPSDSVAEQRTHINNNNLGFV